MDRSSTSLGNVVRAPCRTRWRELTDPLPEGSSSGSRRRTCCRAKRRRAVGRRRPRAVAGGVESVKNGLRSLIGVHDVTGSFEGGPREMRIGIKPAAETDRARFGGCRPAGAAGVLWRGSAAHPARPRRHPSDGSLSSGRAPLARQLENMRIRTPDADEIPFGYVAAVDTGRASPPSAVNRNRAISVTAAVEETATSAGAVYAALAGDVMPAVERDHARVHYSFEGSQADQAAVVGSLRVGFPLALFTIFALLAIPLRSYVSRSSS